MPSRRNDRVESKPSVADAKPLAPALLSDASASNVHDWMRSMAANTQTPASLRRELLQDIQWLAAQLIEEIRPTLPDKAPVKWRDREITESNPYLFAQRVYAEYIGTITKSDLLKLDKSLVNRMSEYDKEHGKPPAELYIPTKAEERLQTLGTVSWHDILAASPPNVRRLIQAYQAQGARKARNTSR